MSNIFYLNATEFFKEGQHLSINMPGLTFVMYHSNRCTHCKRFEPEFKRLPSIMRGVNFCLCNVDAANRPIVEMSKTSSTPISVVPKFILYNNGLPSVEYNGPRTTQDVLNFLQEIISKLDQKQSFTRQPRTRQDNPIQQSQPQDFQSAGPTRPDVAQVQQMQPQMNQSNQTFKITPSTGVKEYETSYGRPYNTSNESDFLEYEKAYKQQMGISK